MMEARAERSEGMAPRGMDDMVEEAGAGVVRGRRGRTDTPVEPSSGEDEEATGRREKIYARSVHGRFRSIRWMVSAVLLGVYFLLPWVSLHGRPAVLVDVPGRKFYLFDLIIWPQEVYYLAIFMLVLVMAFFLFTAIGGRLWCGYACPQTVFTDLFMTIERLVEGDRGERMKLDHGGVTLRKVVEKAAKHSAWLVVSFAVAFTFVAYFIPARELASRIAGAAGADLTGANLFWLAFFTLTTYGFCGILRELICLVPCPYGRFQSALFDRDTLIIGYDARRGEPRGHVKKGAAAEANGDCVDCTLCVQVCPTGIDIRKGLQCECIACAQCIDACDAVMKRLDRPGGLIRYGSLRSLEEGRGRIFRPRLVVYSLIIAVSFSVFSYKVATRSPVDLDVLRDRSALFQRSGDGRVSNLYTIKAMNKDTVEHRYLIKAVGIDADMVIGDNPVAVAGGEVMKTTLALILRDGQRGKRISRFDFVIEDVDDPAIRATTESTFLVPGPEPDGPGKRF